MTLKIGTLTPSRADGLRRIRDRGPSAWDAGTSRQSALKMFRAMAADGLCTATACTAAPFAITDAGRLALDAYDAEVDARRQRRQPLRLLGVARYG